MTTSQVSGGNGCSINTVSAGPEDGPLVVAIHGIGGSRLAFQPLLDAADERGWRVVAMDLRGHGDSDKPHDAYGDSQLWADDVHAVLQSAGASAGRRAVVLAWSYGGAVITDYLRAYGDDLVSGIVTLGATTKLGGPVGEYVQPAFGKLGKGIMTDDTGETAEQLLDLCSATPIEPAFRSAMLEESKKCPAYVRNGMFRRTLDNDDVLAGYGGRVVVTQGDADQMFTMALAEHLNSTAKNSRLSVYEGVGHMPLWEAKDRFLDDVATLIQD